MSICCVPCAQESDGTTAEGELCGAFTVMRRGRQPLFTNKTVRGSEWEGEEEQSKGVSCCVGICAFPEGAQRRLY